MREQEIAQKVSITGPDRKFDNPQEQYLYEKQQRRTLVNNNINVNRLRYLRKERTKLLSQINAGETPTINMMRCPKPITAADGKDMNAYVRMRMAAKKGKWSQADLAKIVVNSTWDGEDCTLAHSMRDKEI